MREIVKHEVDRTVVAYERTVGGPRHAVNEALLNQISGGVRVLKILGGIAVGMFAIAGSCVGIYVAFHHH